MNLLLVNQHYPPDGGATGRLLAQLAERLAARGHRVTVLTGRPTYAEARGVACPAAEVRRGVRIVRVPLLPRRAGALARAVHYLSFAAAMLWRGVRLPRPDLVLAWSSTPMFGGVASRLLAARHRCPFVYGVQDVYPEIAQALGVLRNRAVVAIARFLETRAWRGADRVVVIGEAMRGIATARGIDPADVAVIPNWADTETIRPRTGHAFRREVGLLDDEFVVQYAGNVGRSQDLETVLETARLIEERARAAAGEPGSGPSPMPVRFLVVGSGAREATVQRAAADVACLRTAPWQPEARLPEVLGAADLSLVPLKAGLARWCVPSKVYSILASGRPVGAMMDEDSDVARIVESGECGFRVDPDDPAALADEILRLATNRDRARRLGDNGRRWSERSGSLDTAVDAWESLLVGTADGSRTGA